MLTENNALNYKMYELKRNYDPHEYDRLLSTGSSLRAELAGNHYDNMRNHIVHLSHNDLDGIAALSVSYYMAWYLNRHTNPIIGDCIPRLANPLMEWYSTGRLGDSFRTELHTLAHRVDHILEAEVSRVSTGTVLNDVKTVISVKVLITDINSITMDMLRTEFFQRLHIPKDPLLIYDIRVLVLDHHQSLLLGENDTSYYENGGFSGFFSDPNEDHAINAEAEIVIQTGDQHCGASILLDLIDNQPDPELRMLRNTIRDVTMWDTGRAGNWYIPPEEYDNADYYNTKVTEAVKLNQWYDIYRQKMNQGGNALAYHTFMRELAMRYTASLTVVDSDMALSVHYGSHADEIRDSVIELNKNFDNFYRNIRTVRGFINETLSININGVERVLDIPDWLYHASQKYLNDSPRVGVYLRTDPKKDYPAFTNYARYIYEAHPKNWAWIMIIDTTDETGMVTFDLRSGDPSVNMARWAKTFGGGGHPCAAGFKLIFNETKGF